MEPLTIIAFGLLIGLVGGYAGIGGAPFLVFLLGFFLDWPQHLAQGTVVAVMLGPMSLPGVVVMWDRIRPHLKLVAISVLTYAAFSYVGAELAYLFSNQPLRLLFSALLAALGLRYLVAPKGRPDDAPRQNPFRPTNLNFSVLGALVGVVGGLFGIGAGVLLLPVLIHFFGMDKDDARGISLAILLPPVSIGAVVKYHSQGDVDWVTVLLLFVAYFASNYWGAKAGRAQAPERFRRSLGTLLLLAAILYAARTLWSTGS